MVIQKRYVLIFIAVIFNMCGVLVMRAGIAFAQIDTVSNDLQISLSPKYPKPHETVHATVVSYSFNTPTTPFSWFVNGKLVEKGIGKTSLSFAMGDIGSKTDIRVTATPRNTPRTYDKTITVYASDVTLLWSANTYTPPGYRGKALPTNGSTVKITALPAIIIGGKRIAPTSLMYEWSLDDEPLRNYSGIGRDVLFVSISNSPGIQNRVKLTVEDINRQVTQQAIATIVTRTPVLRFYEIDPLRGPLFRKNLTTSVTARAGSEIQFLATPFYMSNSSLPVLKYLWKVDREILKPGETPEILSYRTEPGSSGTQTISLEITNPNYIPERVTGLFTVTVQ